MTDSARERPLREYARKRHFDATPEPAADAGSPADAVSPTDTERGDRADAGPDTAGTSASAGGRFVVHEHHARRLHWDLRLERDGVLVSWAIPNGIPDHPAHNRKAVHVEDHPLSYIDFAGTIPAGNYGAGEVSVWDRGHYSCEKWEPNKVVVVFSGERLRGRYALFHAGRAERDWMIHRMDPPADPEARELPRFITPVQPTSGALPAADDGWAFEVAWVGVRAQAHSEPGRFSLRDADGEDITARFGEVRALNRALSSHTAILDGEIVAFDADGRPSTTALASGTSSPVRYVIFDLLWLDGHSLLELPYRERRARLEALDLTGEHWQVPPYHRGDGAALLRAAENLGLEAIIAKPLDGAYDRDAAGWLRVSAAD